MNFNPRTPLQSAIPSFDGIKVPTHYFNPRTPLQSAILSPPILPATERSFQSTHSITECDRSGTFTFTIKVSNISIHALHYRVRWQITATRTRRRKPFQSTHSITECDGKTETNTFTVRYISIHALHYRVRSPTRPLKYSVRLFQSTHSITECDVRQRCC